MPEFKTVFFTLSSPFTPMLPIPVLQKMAAINLIVPVYHTVSDYVPDHIKHLYPIKDTKTFRQDLDTLLKYYKPATIQDLIEYAERGNAPKNPSFHLTFDDGLSEFYSIIAPILKEKGIPATCFLNNDFIDNKNLFFRFKESILITHLHEEPVGSPAWKIFHEWTKEHNLGQTYYRKLILGISYKQSHLLDKLATGLGINFDEYLKNKKPYLETSQIEKLIKDGFTFGSHSADHIEYRYINEEEQLENTRQSMDKLLKIFNLDYKAFSFPFTDFGISRSFYEKVKEDKIVEVTFGCAGIKKDIAPISQQRIPIELYKESCKTALKKEYLYYLFLKATGKGRMQRN